MDTNCKPKYDWIIIDGILVIIYRSLCIICESLHMDRKSFFIPSYVAQLQTVTRHDLEI